MNAHENEQEYCYGEDQSKDMSKGERDEGSDNHDDELDVFVNRNSSQVNVITVHSVQNVHTSEPNDEWEYGAKVEESEYQNMYTC